MLASDPTVFVVDDDPGVRHSVRALMDSVGLRVKTFERARDFLETYDPAWPGCLMLDVRMPDMSGLEVQEELARREVNLPIVFITGFGEVSVETNALRAGAIDFLEKPYDTDQLLQAVRWAIRVDSEARTAK